MSKTFYLTCVYLNYIQDLRVALRLTRTHNLNHLLGSPNKSSIVRIRMLRLLPYTMWEMIQLLLVLIRKPAAMHKELLVMEKMHKEQVLVMELLLMVDLSTLRKCYRMLSGRKMSMLRRKPLLVMWERLWGKPKRMLVRINRFSTSAIFLFISAISYFFYLNHFLHCPSIRFLEAVLATLLMLWGR
jgi:hypothetical protein